MSTDTVLMSTDTTPFALPFIGGVKIPVGFFLGHEACANLLGELTRPTAVGEATIEVRTSPPGQECKPTQLTRRAPSGDPPGGDRMTHWQKCQPTLQ